MSRAAEDNTTRRHSPIYAIFGSEDFLRSEALARIMADVLGPQREQMALAEYEGPDADLADVLDECRTASLLAPMRLVIVREADDFISNHREALEKYAKSPSATAVLVLECTKWASSTRLYKIVDQLGGNIACNELKGNAVTGWVTSRCQSAYGCRMDPTTARRLVELVGGQLGMLNMELSKLAVYVSPRKQITEQDVEELVGASRAETVFMIADALCDGDARRALELWDQLVALERDAEWRAVGGLTYSLRRLAEAKRSVERGMTVSEAARRFGFFTDANRLGRQLQRFTLTQWEDLLKRLLEIDLGAKTGLASPREAIEKLIVSLCAGRATRPRLAG